MDDGRIVVGILEDKSFISKSNGHECSYLNIGYEKFSDPNIKKKYSYDKINVREFFCESQQAFLTSNADQLLSKFRDRLVVMKATESLKKDTKCNYTVYFETAKEPPVEDFIEIIEGDVPNPNRPVVVVPQRISTRFVFFDTKIYTLEGAENQLHVLGINNVFFNEEELKLALKKIKVVKQEKSSSSSKNKDSDKEIEFSEVSQEVADEVANKIYSNLSAELSSAPLSELNSVSVDDILEERLNEKQSLKDSIISSVNELTEDEDFLKKVRDMTLINTVYANGKERSLSTIGTAFKDKNAHEASLNEGEENLNQASDATDEEEGIRTVTQRVLVGPFFVVPNTNNANQSQEFEEFSYNLVIPDKGPFTTSDIDNATTKYIPYDEAEKFVSEINFGGIIRKYVVQIENWSENNHYIDYIDDKKIIDKYCAPVIQKEFRNLKQSISMTHFQSIMNSIKSLRSNPRRCKRALVLIENVANYDAQRSKLFANLEENPSTKKFIEEYIETHYQDMLVKYRRELLDDIKAEQKKARGEVTNLQNQLAILTKNVEKAEKNANKSNTAVENSAPKGRTVSSEEHGVLMAEHKQLLRDCENLRKELNNLEKTKSQIGETLKSEAATLSARYLDMHAMLKAFTAVQPSNSNFSFNSQVPSNIKIDNLSKSRNRFIEELSANLRSMGRIIDRDNLVAAIVSIAQNKFTIFAGLPGSGKTSFVKCLGKSLNLNNRMLSIPVARGWTSQRDVLGYWNSLVGTFQAAPTGLWELLNTLDSEKDSSQVTPSIVLLDEMNLSSPEHYFSSFMDLSSGESDGRIFTGSPEKPYLKVPEYLHFIGTVNSDDTVNVMSPRMLDRSAVILFEQRPSQGKDNRIVKQNLDPMPTYSAQDWATLFGSTDTATTNSVYQVLNEIEEHLASEDREFGQRIVVSFRKHQQFINFVNVALGLLDNDEQRTVDLLLNNLYYR